MSDRWTSSTIATRTEERPPDATTSDRVLRRPRTLPGSRAVLGGLLVAVAVVGVVASHLAATAAPTDRYLVAATDLTAGTLLGDAATVQRSFRAVAMDLPDDVAAAAVPLGAAGQLIGRRVTATLAADDLLLASVLSASGAAPGASTFTFAMPPHLAVGGRLTAGDRIDVVATVGTAAQATTAYVVRAATLVDVRSTGGGLGGERVELTVELTDPAAVQALAHALATAQVVVVRSADDGTEAPPPYRFDRGAVSEGRS